MFHIPSVFLLLLIAVGFLMLALWARRAHRTIIRWPGMVLCGVLSLIGFLLLGAALYGYWEINHDRGNPVPELQVAITPERIERGAKFSPYCTSCHGASALASPTGKDFLGGEGAPPVGRFWAPNLTPVHLADWSDGELSRAIREGIHRDGRGLLIMPSQLLHHLSDEDVAALIAWLRNLPAEGKPTPTNRLNALGAIVAPHIELIRDQPPITGEIPHPDIGPNAEYGAYLYDLSCALCHGSEAEGKPAWDGPALLHIPVVWEEGQFIDFMRTGRRPDGSNVDGDKMPWKDMSLFLSDDDDLRAIFRYVVELRGD